MTKSTVQEGSQIEIMAPSGGAVAGGIWLAGARRTGVYLETAASGLPVNVALEGVHTVTKKAGASDALSLGQRVWCLTTGGVNRATAVSGSNKPLGFAVAAATTGATTCRVKLAGW